MPARTGPSLPQSLLEELQNQENTSHKTRSKSANRQPSRKEARKQDRQSRKQRKAQFFTPGHTQDSRPATKRNADGEHSDSPSRKKTKITQSDATSAKLSVKSNKKSQNDSKSSLVLSDHKLKLKSNSKRTLEKQARHSESYTPTTPAILRSRHEEEEDAYIAYLESKLSYSKGGKRAGQYGKGEDDGLDDLLQDLDSMERSVFSRSETKVANHGIGPSQESSSDEESVSGSEGTGSPDEDGDSPGDAPDYSDEWTGFGDSEKQADVALDSSVRTQMPTQAPTFSTVAASGSRYVPPHLRNREQAADADDSEAHIKLTRQLKGLLNRMSEQNIASIIDSVEETYRNYRRHDVTSTLTALIVDGISSHSMLLDSYVVLHAAFVSALHKLVGVEFAAFFLQHVVASYERHFDDLQKGEGPAPVSRDTAEGQVPTEGDSLGKECSNLIILLSELYNFQVISCVLVYDIIRGLLDGDLSEFKIELLLKVTRNSGPQLRQDDPTALKSIIQIVHDKLPSQANAMSSRARFMIETLTNLKNNKIKRNASSAGGGDAVERLKKFLAGLSKKRHVLAHEPLRVSLEDLHSAESKGKWWLVGAAWGGDPLVEHQESRREAESKTETDTLSENSLLKLARKQGMNTEIRRGIFVVLMSSEDYVDACERLSQLKLTEVQQREIIRVILHCCGNEKTHNPYYTLVGQQLCRTSHSHKITLQFCLWDFLRDMGETTVGGAEIIKSLGEDSGFNVNSISSTRMRNVARAYGWWIAKDCCTLAILKPVDFTVLQRQSQEFLKELFAQIFISTQVSTPLLSVNGKDLPTTRNRGPLEEVFIKAARLQTLAVGLLYFLSEAFKGKGAEDASLLKWASQVARDTLRTGMDVVPGM